MRPSTSHNPMGLHGLLQGYLFQAEVYAIKACTVENLVRDYKNRNINILLDCHAAIKTLDNYQINSNLVLDAINPS
jgi:adenylate kinase